MNATNCQLEGGNTVNYIDWITALILWLVCYFPAGPVLPIKERSVFVPVECTFKKGFMTSF